MVHISVIPAALALITTVLGAPAEQATVDRITKPNSDWHAVKLIDIYPNATYNGLPANSSIIAYYDPPKSLSIPSISPAVGSLAKRVSRTCWGTGSSAFRGHMWGVHGTVCSDASGTGNGGSFSRSYSKWYDSGANTWRDFVNEKGQTTFVFFAYRVNPGYVFNWNICYNGFYDIIRDCGGATSEMSRGGFMEQYNNGQSNPYIDVN